MESLLFSRLSQSGKAPAAQEAAGFKLSQVLCGLAFEAHLGRFPEDDLSIFLIRQDLQTVLFFYAEQSSHIDREDHSPQLVLMCQAKHKKIVVHFFVAVFLYFTTFVLLFHRKNVEIFEEQKKLQHAPSRCGTLIQGKKGTPMCQIKHKTYVFCTKSTESRCDICWKFPLKMRIGIIFVIMLNKVKRQAETSACLLTLLRICLL